MNSTSPAPSKAARRTGLVLTLLSALGLAFSAVMKFAGGTSLEEGMAHLGIPMTRAVGIGVLELACTLLYLVARTSVLGAILLTGYLGGATAIHVRVGDPFLATVILGAVVWAGIYLREPRLRALVPCRR